MPATIVIPPNYWNNSVSIRFQLTDEAKRPFPAEIVDASGWVAGAKSFSIGVDGGTINIPCNDELPSPPGQTPQVGSFWLVEVQETNHQPIYHVQISSASPPTNWNELIEAGTPVDPADIWSGRLGPADAVAGQYQQFDGLAWQAVDPPAGTGNVTAPPGGAIIGNMAIFNNLSGTELADGGPPGVGAGDMTKAVYDPQNISADIFARANHTGTQTLATISDAGDSASRNIGTGALDVAAGDAPASSVAAHDASGTAHGSLIPSSDQKAALDANATLNAGNAVASLNDIAVLEEDELVKVSSDDSTAGYLQPKMTSGDGSIVFSVINPGTDEILDLRATGAGGGESNIGQNVGTGSGVYKGKNGVALQFRTLLNTATITWSQGVDDLSATVPAGVFDPDGSAATVQADLDAHKIASPHPGHLLEVQAGANVDVDNTDAQRPIVSAVGDMVKATYDPGNVNDDAFARANHSGTQTLATISDSGTAAAQDVGIAINNVPQLVNVGAGTPGFSAIDGRNLTNLPVQAGTTNLSITYTPTTFTVVSDTGNDGLVANAVASGNAGALSGARAALIDAAYGPSNQPPLFSAVAPGYVGASGGGSTNFLRADGMWVAPSGGGDMTKAVYDPTNVNDDTFARANHTGTQTLSTISDAGTAAARTIGLALTNVPELIDVGGGTPGFGVIDGRNLTNLPGGGGGANLSITYTPTTFTVVSDSGTDGVVAQAIAGGDAGALSGADKTRIDESLQQAGSTVQNITHTEQALGSIGGGTSIVDLSLGTVITGTLTAAQIINFTNLPARGYWTVTLNTQSNGVTWQANAVAIDLPDGYDVSGSPQRIIFSFVNEGEFGVSMTERKVP